MINRFEKTTIIFLLVLISSVCLAKLQTGYVFPQIVAQDGYFDIFYLTNEGVKYRIQVDSRGNVLKQQSEIAEIPEVFWRQEDKELEKRYQLEYVYSRMQHDDLTYFLGVTSDSRLQIYVQNNITMDVKFKDLGYTLVMEFGPYCSNLVYNNNKLYIVAWILGSEKETLKYDMVIYEWDYMKNVTRIYPIAQNLTIYNTTLSLAATKGMLGLVYYAVDNTVPFKLKNRIRLVLIDIQDLTIKKNIWISK